MIRVVIAVVLLLALPACDYFFSATPDYPFPESPVELARVEGPLPARDRTLDLVLRIWIDPEGEHHLRGEVVDRRRLAQRTLVYAERRRDMEHPDQPSTVRLHAFVDRRAPWAAVRTLLLVAADPDIRIACVDIVVISAGSGEVCTLPVRPLLIQPPMRLDTLEIALPALPPAVPRGFRDSLREITVRTDEPAEEVLRLLARLCREETGRVRVTTLAAGDDR